MTEPVTKKETCSSMGDEDNRSPWKAEAFCLEEYGSLRKEVELYLTESRSQERNTLIALGAVWAFLIVNHLNSPLLWSVPIVLASATTIRMAAIWLHFIYLGRYIKKIESRFDVRGWEHEKNHWALGAAYALLDVVLLVLTVLGYHYRVTFLGFHFRLS